MVARSLINEPDVLFLDDQRGWIAGEFGVLLATTDAGQTWKPCLAQACP